MEAGNAVVCRELEREVIELDAKPLPQIAQVIDDIAPQRRSLNQDGSGRGIDLWYAREAERQRDSEPSVVLTNAAGEATPLWGPVVFAARYGADKIVGLTADEVDFVLSGFSSVDGTAEFFSES